MKRKNEAAVEKYFENLYFVYKQYRRIDPCAITNIKFEAKITNHDKEYFLKYHIAWLEYLLTVNYNYGIYRLLLKISKEWRALHVDIERKQNAPIEPFKVVIDMKDKSNVK